MTRDEQLAFCKKCQNRKFDPQQGIICRITDKKADFEDECPNFELDENVKEESFEPQREIPTQEVVQQLSTDVLDRLKVHQKFGYALIGGIMLSILCAILWAAVSISTGYQIGYMAIGVGFVIGMGIRFLGAGIEMKFGILGGFLALIGCLLGNLFSQIGFLANAQNLGYFDAFLLFDFSVVPQIFAETFGVMDLVFYGLAIVEGYKFAFRPINAELLTQLKNPEFDPEPQGSKLRMPFAIGSFLVIAFLIFSFNKGAGGDMTFYYDDGTKMSEGHLENGLEEGDWKFYYTNGELQAQGSFIHGQPDSNWIWYDEDGNIISEGTYKNGIQHGKWVAYHAPFAVSDSGYYENGRKQGEWYTYDIGGSLLTKGTYEKDMQQGLWQTFSTNGQKTSEGNYVKSEQTGRWEQWYENGQKSFEFEYSGGDLPEVINSWNESGKPMVVNGNGTFEIYYATGELMESGTIRNKKRTGKWTNYYLDGSKREEGNYQNDEYLLSASWAPDGSTGVVAGNGNYISYYDDHVSVLEEGTIQNGKRSGEWTTRYQTNGNPLQTITYDEGIASGRQTLFFESGVPMAEGNLKNGEQDGEWKWYYETGQIQTSVLFESGVKTGTQTFWNEIGTKVKEEIYQNGELVEERSLVD